MVITDEYIELMNCNNLPERFRAGDFGLLEEESATLREFVDNFYESVEDNGCVTLEDFTEFMGFLHVLMDADSQEAQRILTGAFARSAKIQNGLSDVNPYL